MRVTAREHVAAQKAMPAFTPKADIRSAEWGAR